MLKKISYYQLNKPDEIIQNINLSLLKIKLLLFNIKKIMISGFAE